MWEPHHSWIDAASDQFLPDDKQAESQIQKLKEWQAEQSVNVIKDLIWNWHIPIFSHGILQHAMKCLSSRLIQSFSHRISWSPTFISDILFESAYKYLKICLLDGGPQKYDTFCNYSNVSKIQITVSQIDEFNFF